MTRAWRSHRATRCERLLSQVRNAQNEEHQIVSAELPVRLEREQAISLSRTSDPGGLEAGPARLQILWACATPRVDLSDLGGGGRPLDHYFAAICPAQMTIVSAFLGDDHFAQLGATAY